ncbi:hypothetical protein ACFLRW_07755, partial [Acidobacteriota bacterium]
MNKRRLRLFVLFLAVVSFQFCDQNETVNFTPEVITEYWTSGKTLPLEVSEKYPFDPQKIEIDNGYNVLIDLAHQCKFISLWRFAPRLNRLGYRALTSHASLHSVLDPKGLSRARIMYDKENKIFPFSWIPNPPINVIITEQSDPNAQDYLDEEQEALIAFVNRGGGLVIIGAPVEEKEKIEDWSLNRLAQRFGAELTEEVDQYQYADHAVIKIGENWEAVETGENGGIVIARKVVGQGRIMLLGGNKNIHVPNDSKEEDKSRIAEFLNTSLVWLTESQDKIEGEA